MGVALLPALAVALTGTAAVGPILLVTALLTSSGGRPSAWGFLAGYLGMYSAIGMAVVAAGLEPARWVSGEAGPAGATAGVAVGVALVALGLWTASRSSSDTGSGAARRSPPLLDRATPPRAFLLGLTVASVNLKNLALYLTAIAVLQAGELSTGGKLAAAPLVAAVFCLAAFVPLGIDLAMPARSGRALARLRGTIERQGRRVGAVLLVVVGLVLVARGVRGLA